MSWIPLRHDLSEDPAVIGIAAALGMDEDHVVGKLHRVWSWFDRQTIDGVARSVTQQWIDKFTATTGFADAMVREGWLVSVDGTLTMPNFDRWISESAKTRLLASRRKRKERERIGDVTEMSRNKRDKNATRVEKNRKDSSLPEPGTDRRKSSGDSVFEDVTTETLRDSKLLRAWFDGQLKSKRPVLSSSRESWEFCCECACEAVAEGDNPPALFVSLVIAGPSKAEISQESKVNARKLAKGLAA